MKKSYCGLCERCNLDNPDFLQAIATVKRYLDQFWVYWWINCYPDEGGFSLIEFRKAIEWFLNRPECQGCVTGHGLNSCPIRQCAISRGYENCGECPDLNHCEHFDLILSEYPNQKRKLQQKEISSEKSPSEKN
jgi:hypothetical protein